LIRLSSRKHMLCWSKMDREDTAMGLGDMNAGSWGVHIPGVVLNMGSCN